MIVKYWLKSPVKFTVSIILNVFATVFTVVVPGLSGMIVGRLGDGVSPNFPGPVETFQRLFQVSGAITLPELFGLFMTIIIAAFLAFILNRKARIINAEVASKAIYYIRKDIHDAIYIQSFSYFDKTETGQLVARATSDVEQSEMLFGFALNLGIQGLLTMGGAVLAAIATGSVETTLLFVAVMASAMAISWLVARRLKPIFVESREAFGQLTNTLRENIVGSQVVRIFSTQKKERGKFAVNNDKFLDASVRSVKYSTIFMPLTMGSVITLYGVIFLVIGRQVIFGLFPLSTLVTLSSLAGLLVFPLFILGQIMLMYVQADASLTRVREVIDSTPEITEPVEPVDASGVIGNVEFRSVSFGYTSDHYVLEDVSFKVPAGTSLAILGTTGSGKSTVISLLPRFYDVVAGSVLIDGIDVRDYGLNALRKQIGLVSQETFLFNKSILDNIRYGKTDASTENVIEAAKAAGIHEFIESLPEGYDTVVGERGARLSGGQKQRLSIARALLIKPRILVFDDSTSSVDVETEYKIQQALKELMKDTTSIIITQRVSTIRGADQILLLEKGRVVGSGTHAELLESNALYNQIITTLVVKQGEGGIP